MEDTERQQFRPSTVLFLAVCGALLILSIAGLATSIGEAKAEKDMLSRNGCKFLRQDETGRNVYCGKACFRPELRLVYACRGGEIVLIN